MFKTQLENTGLATTKACADDIGVALRQLQSLPTLCLWFQCFTKVSGLALGPAKCIIVLTSITASVGNIGVIKSWLLLNCPSWKDMLVCDAAKYLGFFLGPKSSVKQWTKAAAKFKIGWSASTIPASPPSLPGFNSYPKLFPPWGMWPSLCLHLRISTG